MKDFKVALQLYSVRDEMAKDMDATLKAVKEMGYDYVEFAGYFGKSAEEVRAILDKYNLNCISVHQGYETFLDEPQKSVDYLKTIGTKYCAVGVRENMLKGHAELAETADKITQIATLLKENGIQMMYHNHDYEFHKYEGKFLLDRLYESVPADLLQPQIDTCLVSYAGYDPCEYIAKYAGRIEVLHLKDFAGRKLAQVPVFALDGNAEKAQNGDDGFEFRPVGHGIQDFPAILDAAGKAGIGCVIVEQDEWPTATSLESAKQSREYLKSLGL